jgi:hypothetical protein
VECFRGGRSGGVALLDRRLQHLFPAGTIPSGRLRAQRNCESRMALSSDGESAGLPRFQKRKPLRRRTACGRSASRLRVRSNPSTTSRNRAPGPIDSQDLPSQFRAGPKAPPYPSLGQRQASAGACASPEGAGQERRTQIGTPFQGSPLNLRAFPGRCPDEYTDLRCLRACDQDTPREVMFGTWRSEATWTRDSNESPPSGATPDFRGGRAFQHSERLEKPSWLIKRRN